MYIIYKVETGQQLPSTIQVIGNYIGYNVALIEDSIAEKLNLDNIQFRILPSKDVALCYKFAGMEGGYISVKKGNDAETIDPHIQQICNSMEQLGDVEKVKYNFTDDDKDNTVIFLKLWMRFVLDNYYEHKLKSNNLDVTKIEELSWDQQRKEAESYIADNSIDTPLLTKLAEARGISVLDMATKVNTAISTYYENMATLLSKKQKIETEIKACNTRLDCHVLQCKRFDFWMTKERWVEAGQNEEDYSPKIDL